MSFVNESLIKKCYIYIYTVKKTINGDMIGVEMDSPSNSTIKYNTYM